MLKPWQFMLLSALGLVSLALVVANIVLFTANREAQKEFSTRAQYIQQGQAMMPLYVGTVRKLTEIADKTGDPQIIRMLKSHGFPPNINQPQKDGAAPAAKATEKVK